MAVLASKGMPRFALVSGSSPMMRSSPNVNNSEDDCVAVDKQAVHSRVMTIGAW